MGIDHSAKRPGTSLTGSAEAEASYRKGLDYYHGINVSQMDGPKAAEHFREAAERNHADAQEMLEYIYRRGYIVPKDIAEADKWARRATKQRESDQRENDRRARETKDLTALFIHLNAKALADPLSIELTSPTPDKLDRALIERWMPEGTDRRESELRRLLSARLAEKAVGRFFESQGFGVEDVSIRQVLPQPDSEWTKYDLRVDGRPLDVKNARRSRENPDRYVGYCVPRFKEDRNQAAVEVVGALSHWLTLPQMESGGSSVLFLGTTTAQDQKQLQDAVAGGPLELGFRKSGAPSFFPPWVFNYPPYLYKSRMQALEEIGSLSAPDWRRCTEAGISPFPAFIATNRRLDLEPRPPLSRGQFAFAELLASRLVQVGSPLAVVFLSVLEHFLRMLSASSTDSYSPEDYAPLLFPTSDRTRPLFLADPLKTIDALLWCLSILWKERSNRLAGFRVFRLQDYNILQGKASASDARWCTMLAYCGGWIEAGNRPCGTIPLVLGQCESCYCGKLICPECDFCSEQCLRRLDSEDGESITDA